MKKNLLITNPLSGKYKKDKVDSFSQKLRKIGLEVSKIELKKDQKIKGILENLPVDEYETVFLAFGDGTINSAINAIAARDDFFKFKICIVPFGTANVLANELGTNTTSKVIKAIKKNQVKKLHLGKVINLDDKSERYFSLMASSGFDSMVVSKINEKVKEKFGKFAYIQKLFSTIIRRYFPPLKTQIGNRKYKSILTCVSNGKYYGGRIHVSDSKLDDNSFNVILIKKFSVISILEYIITRKTNKNIIRMKAKNVKIMSDNPNYPLQMDGDCYGNLPVKIENTNKFINVIYL